METLRYFIRLVPAGLFSALCYSFCLEHIKYGGDSFSIFQLGVGWLLSGAFAWHCLIKIAKNIINKII
tara:strand:- start:166 stop:369 length:204 start_codon:yes stop_codon:yes gene_type:complete